MWYMYLYSPGLCIWTWYNHMYMTCVPQIYQYSIVTNTRQKLWTYDPGGTVTVVNVVKFITCTKPVNLETYLSIDVEHGKLFYDMDMKPLKMPNFRNICTHLLQDQIDIEILVWINLVVQDTNILKI